MILTLQSAVWLILTGSQFKLGGTPALVSRLWASSTRSSRTVS
ncbi:hypothetical protein [Moraxella catarrhalis]|nr:hypothetical protein [Moraxella catarrhalis]